MGGGGGRRYISRSVSPSVAKAHSAATAVYDGFSTKHSQEGEEGEGGKNHSLSSSGGRSSFYSQSPNLINRKVTVTGQNRTRCMPA